MKALFLVLFVGSFAVSLDAETFLQRAHRYSSKSLFFQKIHARRALKTVGQDYKNFIASCTDEEFEEHLRFSFFGNVLVSMVEQGKTSKASNVSQLKEQYSQIVSQELDRISKFLKKYFQESVYQAKVFEWTFPYAAQYLTSIRAIESGELALNKFHAMEHYLASSIASLPVDAMSREAIRTFLFLEVQTLTKL